MSRAGRHAPDICTCYVCSVFAIRYRTVSCDAPIENEAPQPASIMKVRDHAPSSHTVPFTCACCLTLRTGPKRKGGEMTYRLFRRRTIMRETSPQASIAPHRAAPQAA